MSHENFSIRYATEEDASTIQYFIKALAEHLNFGYAAVATEELLRENIFEKKYAEVIFACVDSKPIGFALFFYTLSTLLGKPSIYLEDLFIEEEYRGKGYGKALLRFMARLALEKNCGRFEWSVLDWNQQAVEFYNSLKAFPLSESTVFRLTGDALQNLANES